MVYALKKLLLSPTFSSDHQRLIDIVGKKVKREGHIIILSGYKIRLSLRRRYSAGCWQMLIIISNKNNLKKLTTDDLHKELDIFRNFQTKFRLSLLILNFLSEPSTIQ